MRLETQGYTNRESQESEWFLVPATWAARSFPPWVMCRRVFLRYSTASQARETQTKAHRMHGKPRITDIFLLVLALVQTPAWAADKPNIIFILSDDLAQGDVGAYGQKLIQTPNLDRMSGEGTRFMQAYCGTTVCAPSRASLMTGLHTGHSPIRANREVQPEGQKPLPAETFTVAQLLKSQGYATATIGKWGMGMFDTTGSPLKKGVDHFFGYNCQRHAHSYFPTYLYNDDKRMELPGNDGNKNVMGKGSVYAQDLIADETLRWVREHKDSPFFLFYSITLPHGTFQINSQGIYSDKPWTDTQKNYAAMVTRLDSDVGRLRDLLVELKIDRNTLIVFSGDNGSSFDPNSEIGRLFDQTMGGKLRGFKRSLYEGGLRQASLAWWPGTVPAGRVTEEPWAFWDFLPTVAELVGTRLPESVKTDGHSLATFLRGGDAPKRDYFYWELHEGASLQAARWGSWKAVRTGPSNPIEIYDLASDVSESKDLAVARPDLVSKAKLLFKAAREDHPDWPLVDQRQTNRK
jgi:arylsulfatase A-like enzyme